MKTNFLTLLLVYRFDWRLKCSKMRPIRMLSHWHTRVSKTLQVFFLCEHDVSHVHFWYRTSCVADGHVIFIIVTTVVQIKPLVTHTKHSKYTFVINLTEAMFITKFDYGHFFIKLLRLRQKSVLSQQIYISNKLVSNRLIFHMEYVQS